MARPFIRQDWNRAPNSDAALPRLRFLGRGSHSDVFACKEFVLKARRISALGLLSEVLRSPRWEMRILSELGGLAVPFVRLPGEVAFLAYGMPDGDERARRIRAPMIQPRLEREDFLDARFYAAGAEEAVALLEEALGTLRRVADRGFWMIDFIMKNFAFADGELKIVDAGLVVPLGAARLSPSAAVTTRQFRRWMLRDYDSLLAAKERVADSHRARAAVSEFRRRFPAEIRTLTKGNRLASDRPALIEFPPRLRAIAEARLRPDAGPSPGIEASASSAHG